MAEYRIRILKAAAQALERLNIVQRINWLAANAVGRAWPLGCFTQRPLSGKKGGWEVSPAEL